jgi:hypothetical protein
MTENAERWKNAGQIGLKKVMAGVEGVTPRDRDGRERPMIATNNVDVSLSSEVPLVVRSPR